MIGKTQIYHHAIKKLGYNSFDEFLTDWNGFLLEELLNKLNVPNSAERTDWYVDRGGALTGNKLVGLCNAPLEVYSCNKCKVPLIHCDPCNKYYKLLNPAWDDDINNFTGIVNGHRFNIKLCEGCTTDMLIIFNIGIDLLEVDLKE